MLKQGRNNAQITGILAEMEVERGKGSKEINKQIMNNIDKIKVKLLLRVKEGYEVPVTLNSYALTNAGKENSIYKSLDTMAREYKTIVEAGVEGADKIKITSGEMKHYANKGKDGEVHEGIFIKSNFANRLKENEEFVPKADFTLEGIVKGISDITNEDGDIIEKRIKLFMPVYGGKLRPITLSMCLPEGIEYVADNIQIGSCVSIDGIIRREKIETEKVIKRDFGADKVEKTVKEIKRYEITGISILEDETWDEEEVKVAVKEYENYIESVKNQETQEESKTVGNGFGTRNNSDNSNIDIQTAEIPF